MKQTKFKKYFIGDFETTVYENQDHTEVWASAVVELYTEDVKIFHSIEDTFNYLVDQSKEGNICIYYHNLKFDGAFWLPFLIFKSNLDQATLIKNGHTAFFETPEMPKNSYKYLISDLGEWYSITLNINGNIIEIRDSLKLLPFSVKAIGKSFETKHKKLDMEYEGYRYSGCEITPKEREYIANDVLVVKEAIEIMFEHGYKKLTIGACCLSEFRENFIAGREVYKKLFPDLSLINLDKEKYGSENVDEYIRKSYKGGWCYVVKGKEMKEYHNGTTADVNSLYSSMMSSASGNRYCVGKPTFWKGNFIPDKAVFEPNDPAFNKPYYFVRIRTEFHLKKNKLPCIQIKHDYRYKPREWLETSDLYLKECTLENGKHCKAKWIHNAVELTLTETDFELIKDHYNLVNLEILDGCYFQTEIGLFDSYIDKYKKIKQESTGAKRSLAKLSLNSLYGKMASSKDSSFKYAMPDENNIRYTRVFEQEKKVVYIPIGAAITSYARNFTIRAAQRNFYGVDKPGFIYADTDSIHCDLPPEKIKGIKVDPIEFCCWKLEGQWDIGWFVRPKTYIEHITHEDQKSVENPYYNIKCAGMNALCKKFFEISMQGRTLEEWQTQYKSEWDKMHDIEKEFVLTKRELKDFRYGLVVPGKLMTKHIPGGIVLCSSTFELR